MREWMVTPSVCLDETRLLHNVQLRPHAKTHKTVEIASLQTRWF